ncbi:gas vesicle structural protein GvpA [Streptomyces sp. NBC_00257]|uniref:gas vesicle structural protein GvpA n=1 Tax=Streptomyces TaxID=1883 RepID=UPI000F5BB7A9|nr:MULTISPECIES: gas vesicle structural protein GvpA [unclassified Streptomyces]WSG49598.1 gas vesicle structural protein GvpA [Streptomyces sp. NBC_01732]WSW09056.1 gas vesicle structural protein GvpA [Streptomyces sp. NBC_01005]WSX00250.1 gas vesicle structural protein GvpA [Streptomyces sp. NBC_00987]WTB53097.1 gas vesicle structural protein GvpA [Streptomyces sp. NBC_00826]WTC98562.1 gas vesicle structural protein GvpA [Streptomyces sp. NBC_01650]WTH94012.1 gas vesicle structural protein 
MTMVPQGGGTISRAGGGGSGNLYDILELILDRGLVIDVFVRVSLVGIEILKIDARIVVASVDTYLRFAEACNRLDLEEGRKAPSQLTDLVGEVTEGGAHGKAKGALSGAADVLTDALKGGHDDEEAEQSEKRRKEPEERRERPRRRPAARRREE